jgi:hypothetical protein
MASSPVRASRYDALRASMSQWRNWPVGTTVVDSLKHLSYKWAVALPGGAAICIVHPTPSRALLRRPTGPGVASTRILLSHFGVQSTKPRCDNCGNCGNSGRCRLTAVLALPGDRPANCRRSSDIAWRRRFWKSARHQWLAARSAEQERTRSDPERLEKLERTLRERVKSFRAGDRLSRDELHQRRA